MPAGSPRSAGQIPSATVVPGDVTDPAAPPDPRGGRRADRPAGPAGQQRERAGPEPAAEACRLPDRGVAPRRRDQPDRPAGPDPAAAPAPALGRRHGPQHQLGRGRRGLRGLGRLRLGQGRARPPLGRAGRRGAGAACLCRRPWRPADRDAPAGLPGRGHLRPAPALDRRAGSVAAARYPAAERSLPRDRVGSRGGRADDGRRLRPATAGSRPRHHPTAATTSASSWPAPTG